MARSSRIYILNKPARVGVENATIVAAFTVKYEMLSWAESHGGLNQFELVILKDGTDTRCHLRKERMENAP